MLAFLGGQGGITTMLPESTRGGSVRRPSAPDISPLLRPLPLITRGLTSNFLGGWSMPVRKCANGKWRIGNGPCMYKTKKSADKAYSGYLADKASKKKPKRTV